MTAITILMLPYGCGLAPVGKDPGKFLAITPVGQTIDSLLIQPMHDHTPPVRPFPGSERRRYLWPFLGDRPEAEV